MLKTIKKLLSKKVHANPNKEAKKEQLKNALALLMVACASFGFYWYSVKEPEATTPNKAPAFQGLFDKTFHQNSDEALIAKQQRQIDDLKTMIVKKDEIKAAPDEETKRLIKRLQKQVTRLQNDNKKMIETLQVALLKTSPATNPRPQVRPPTRDEIAAKVLQQQQNEREFYAHAGLETVHFQYRNKTKEETRTPNNYVWAGTFVEGVLLTGVLGDAGVNGSKNMGTAMIRLDSDGIMPNEQSSHLNGCFALVSTFGDLSASSVVLHLETLSCASKSLNFEQKVYGSVFDLDAMQDLRGTSILKTKPLLNYTAAAGALAGLGDGLKNYGSAQTINSNGSITTFSPRAIAQSAAGGAVTNPANRISDYIMRIADLYHPLVVAKAGRRVSVLFTKGFWIDREHQVYESGKAIDEAAAQQESRVSSTISRSSTGVENQAQAATQPPGNNLLGTQEKTAHQFLNETPNQPLFSEPQPGEPAHA